MLIVWFRFKFLCLLISLPDHMLMYMSKVWNITKNNYDHDINHRPLNMNLSRYFHTYAKHLYKDKKIYQSRSTEEGSVGGGGGGGGGGEGGGVEREGHRTMTNFLLKQQLRLMPIMLKRKRFQDTVILNMCMKVYTVDSRYLEVEGTL